MKKIVTLIAAAAMLVSVASPAYADGRDNRWGVDSNRYGERSEQVHREHKHDNTKWVAPLLGGIILGAILTDSRNRSNEVPKVETPVYRETYQYRTYVPQTVCQNEYVHNRYGEIVTDEYGNFILRRRVCWTQ